MIAKPSRLQLARGVASAMLSRMQPVAGASTQILWSAQSFLLSLILARYLSLELFGWFAAMLAVRQFFQSILAAVVLTPLTLLVEGTQSAEDRKAREATAIALVRLVAVAAIGVGAILHVTLGAAVEAYAIFVIGALASDLQRRLSFVHDIVHEDAVGGVVSIVLVVPTLLLPARANLLTLEAALACIGGFGLLWAVFCRPRQWLSGATQLNASHVQEMWRTGGWVLGGNMAGYVCNQVSLFLTLPIVGPAGAGVLEIGRQLVSYVQVLMLGMANVWQPLLARAADKEPREFRRIVWSAARHQTLIGTVVLLPALLLAPLLLPILFPNKAHVYASIETAAWILGGGTILQLLSQHPSFGLIVLRRSRDAFMIRLGTSLVVIPLGLLLTLQWSVPGAALTRLIGEGLILVLCAIGLRTIVGRPAAVEHRCR